MKLLTIIVFSTKIQFSIILHPRNIHDTRVIMTSLNFIRLRTVSLGVFTFKMRKQRKCAVAFLLSEMWEIRIGSDAA